MSSRISGDRQEDKLTKRRIQEQVMKIKENAVEKLQERRTLKLDAQKRQAGGQVKRKKPTGK